MEAKYVLEHQLIEECFLKGGFATDNMLIACVGLLGVLVTQTKVAKVLGWEAWTFYYAFDQQQ